MATATKDSNGVPMRPQVSHVSEGMDPSVGPLLARANLLRMRGQWDEAIAACTEVLRQTPDSATAHALLGDIYEAQGKTDDALQWFSMAVDLDPTNVADRAKFDRLVAIHREKIIAQEAASAHPPKATKEKTLDWIDKQFPPGRSESIARLIWAMSGVMTFLILGCAGFLYFLSQNNGSTPKTGVVASPAKVKTPVLIAPPVSEVRTIPARTVTASNIGDKTSTVPESTSALLNKIKGQTNDITVLSAHMDARTQQILLAIAVQVRRDNNESLELIRERILRSAAAVARIAAQTEAQAITARVSVSLHPENPSPAFVGTILLEEMRKTDLSLATTSEILARFTQLQWTLPGTQTSDGLPQPSSVPRESSVPIPTPVPVPGATRP